MVPDRFAPVLDELAPLAARFGAAGRRLYLVGGAVRDLLVGTDRPRFDLDLTTDARPAEIKRLLDGWADAVWTQGEKFGTIGARHERADGSHQTVEITTFRAEAYADDSRKPHVTFADDVETDLSRRDFTVNAMALELRPDDGGSTPAPSSSTRSAARPISPRPRCGHRWRRRSASTTTRCACCARRGSSPGTASRRCPSSSPRSTNEARAWRSCRPSASATSSTS